MMKKKFFLISLSVLFATIIYSQAGFIDSALIPKPFLHYQQEYTFDKSMHPEVWQQQTPGLNVSFASTDEAWFRTEVPAVSKTQKWLDSRWKGERLNIMILVWSADTINQVRVLLNDLKTMNGNVIGKNNLK